MHNLLVEVGDTKTVNRHKKICKVYTCAIICVQGPMHEHKQLHDLIGFACWSLSALPPCVCVYTNRNLIAQ